MAPDDLVTAAGRTAIPSTPPAPTAAETALAALAAARPDPAAAFAPATDGDRDLVVAIASAFGRDLPPAAAVALLAPAAAGLSSWAGVERLLQIHGCASIAHRLLAVPELRAACRPPTATTDRLRRHYLAAVARNALHPPRLGRLLARFADAAVPVLTIKGVTLGAWLYDDLGLREYVDFDFVVPEARAEAAHALLTDLGYACAINPFLRPRLHPRQTLEAATYRHADEITIDLRFNPWRGFWRLDGSDAEPFAGWWDRRSVLTIGGVAVPTFGPEDQFLQLARHLQEHDYFRAIWFVDLIRLLGRHGADLDWDRIGHEARRHGVDGGVYRTLEVVERVYGARAPAPARVGLRPSGVVRRLHRRAWPDALALESERPNLLANPMGPHHLTLRGLRSRRQAAGLALLLLDRNRARTATHLVRQRFPTRAWLKEVYGAGAADRVSYAALWRRHRRHHRPDNGPD